MQLETKHFGSIEIDEEQVIRFENGIPGFDHLRRFAVLCGEDPESPFRWLQSIDDLNLAFVIVDPFRIKPDYDIEIHEDIVSKLKIEQIQDVQVFSIVVIPQDTSQMTMNLKAPVLINTREKLGAQIVLDTDRYGMRHLIVEELRRQEVTANACANKEEGPVHCNK